MARISRAEQERVRRRFLESAARHFADHGLEGANINSISTAAGYARGTIYNYFASKDELFAEVLAEGSQRTVDRYRERAPRGPVRDRLRALVEEDVALTRRHQPFMRVVVREMLAARAATRSTVETGIRPLRIVVRDLLAEGQAEGGIRSDLGDDRLATVFLGQLAILYACHWQSEGVWPLWGEIPGLVVSLAFDGFTPPRSAPEAASGALEDG